MRSVNHIAEAILGEIEWQDTVTGFLRCPGANTHSRPTARRDCRVKLDGIPTLYCVHASCAGVIADRNCVLRSEIAKTAPGGRPLRRVSSPTAVETERASQREMKQRLKKCAEKSLPIILAEHACEPVDFWEASTHRLENDPANDWRLLLELYRPSDVLWIGDLHQSGKPEHARNFRCVADWLAESSAPGQHICPSPFKAGVCSRASGNVVAPRFLVVESDTLTKEQSCAVFKWLQNVLRLRAIVDTAGKSLHGWFEYDAAEVADLKSIAPALQLDPALFQLAHTCRLPGAARDGKPQHLVYLDLEGAR